MLVHAFETYLGRNKQKLKDKLTSSHSKFAIKIKQKQILMPFYFQQYCYMWMVCCWQLIASNMPTLNTRVLAILLGVDAPIL